MGGPYFVDFEAFQHGNERFQVKELCVIDVDFPLEPLYFLFESQAPTSPEAQTTYNYQTNHIHHLHWNEGTSRYCKACIIYYIKKQFPYASNGIFYVMGKQKLAFLKEEFPLFNFVEYNATMETLTTIPLNIHCLHHNHGEHCACLKCYRLLNDYLHLIE